MAGRIADGDKERVRELNRIESVVGDYVALRSAGGGNLKGLCPFHDEKSPSFNVRPTHGTYHCFGCGQGGDVFSFIAEIEHLTFPEAIERLADRVGFVLTRVEGGSSVQVERGTRSRLVAANKAAAAFYADRLQTPEAAPAREFLAERGFDLPTSLSFGCGFAPGGWDELTRALRKQGFTDKELVTAGLSKEGQRGMIDRFNRRLLWQIRDVTGDVVGFGARRIFDDDRIEAKYLNTSDTPLYHKSQMLYGLDLAKKQIRKERRAVVVEGYTDVMAMHAAGVTTAVASCGTAFGDEHIGVLRRFLMDSEVIRGEVVYTFDGDAAGRNAALKAFDSDQKFAANTFIAVAPDNLDPCELRQKAGDAALRDLIETKKPLFAFAIGSTLSGYDLNTAEGRVAAGRATVPLVAKIKESDLRDQYVNELAPQIGVDPAELKQRVKAAVADQVRAAATAARKASQPAERTATTGTSTPAAPPVDLPRKGDRALFSEREALKLALQQPAEVAGAYEELDASVFTHKAYVAVHEAIIAAGGPAAAPTGAAWVQLVREQLTVPALSALASELANERMSTGSIGPDPVYAGSILAALNVVAVNDRIRDMEAELKRAEAAGDPDWREQLQADLYAMQLYRRALVERANRQN
ncbi:DNA primase [Nakamurella deserti]|uniref:DNA primase n=1 Tax=Nakamurella deserti TaxID=2164074 RepID=UPI000DBE7507|nr:DNA primase [Nakamurella deserti]